MSKRMEELQQSLQFWKNFGYYGVGAFAILSIIAGGIAFFKTSSLENEIRIEAKRDEELARNEFLNKMDKQHQEQLQLQKELQEKSKADPAETKRDPPKIPGQNYEYENDKVNKILKFWPKVGEWKKPIVAYPSNEVEAVKGKFSSKMGIMLMLVEGINNEHNLSFFVAQGGPPASRDNFYALSYESLPSYIVIGDDGVAMWRIELK